MNYYLNVLKKYAVFEGRASRKEYWMFMLWNIIVAFFLGIVLGVAKIILKTDVLFISNIYSLAIFIPSLALGIRRMHDNDKSGWYIIFPFYNIVLLFTSGTKGVNRFGNDPYETNTI